MSDFNGMNYGNGNGFGNGYDDDQAREFRRIMAIRRNYAIMRSRDQMSDMNGMNGGQQQAPRRGRPPGSRNRSTMNQGTSGGMGGGMGGGGNQGMMPRTRLQASQMIAMGVQFLANNPGRTRRSSLSGGMSGGASRGMQGGGTSGGTGRGRRRTTAQQ